MRLARLLMAVTLFAIGGRAAAADLRLGARPELRIGAGYDDNLFLDARPAGPTAAQIHADAIFDVAPRAAGWLGVGGHLLTLAADYLERITFSTGQLRDVTLRLGYATPLFGPVVLSVGGLYEHYQSTFYSNNTFDLGGGDLEIALFVGARVRLAAGWRGAARHYPERLAQLDNDQRASGQLRATPVSWLTVEASYHFVALRSNEPTAELDRHTGEVGFAVRATSWLAIAARYGFGWQHLPAGEMLGRFRLLSRDDLRHSLVAAVNAQPLDWLGIYARYELLDSQSSDVSGNFQRNLFVVGLTLTWAGERRIARPPPTAPTVRPQENGAEVVFRLRATPGRRVSVVGDWNAWDPSASPLVEASPGRYEAAYIVPKGRHEYAFSVDGNIEPPPDAPVLVPDGFGGKNAVLTIP